jgi:hypothetical protein
VRVLTISADDDRGVLGADVKDELGRRAYLARDARSARRSRGTRDRHVTTHPIDRITPST